MRSIGKRKGKIVHCTWRRFSHSLRLVNHKYFSRRDKKGPYYGNCQDFLMMQINAKEEGVGLAIDIALRHRKVVRILSGNNNKKGRRRRTLV